MAKFTKVSSSFGAGHWGPIFRGQDPLPLLAHERQTRDCILDHSMSLYRARAILQQIDGEVPWESSYSFIRALAAHSAVFQAELSRRTHVAGTPLRRIIYNACAPARMQWYFNNLRHRHGLPRSKLALLGSGTSPNEAWHSEINKWCSNQPEIFAITAELQLQVTVFGKLLSHNCALYSPTLRQLRPSNVLHRSVARFLRARSHGPFS